MTNNVYIVFNVSSLSITRTNRSIKVPSGNQNYIFASFSFSSNWDGINKTAIFSKDGIETIHVPIINNVCQIPNIYLLDVGQIKVSVYGGDRRTLGNEIIDVIQGGYKEGIPPTIPTANSIYVQSPDSSITFLGYDDDFWFMTNGEKRNINFINNDIDYEAITNKPQINHITVTGDKSSADLGLQPAGDYALTDDLNAHNTDNTAHSDIRNLVSTEAIDRDIAISSSVNSHDTNNTSHTDIRNSLSQEIAVRVSADNSIMEYVDDKTLLLVAINLFLKASNTMNQIKPTGNGTVVASANSLTTTDRLLFTFNYTAPQEFLLLASNRYMFNIPLQSMSSGRNIINRYVYTVGGNVVCDVTRPQFTVPSNGMFTDSFEIVNNLPNDIVIPNGAIITLQIYGRTTSSSSGMAMLVNDQDNMARVSRNEITAGQSATNIYTIARGYLETQESFNYYVFTELSNLMNL